MLEKFGLTKTEEKVYLVLLKIGISPASKIIKKTQLHRTTVYDVLERLIEKGFVSFIVINKIKSYSAVNPSKFLDFALEKKKQAEKSQQLAKEIIKKLNLIKKDSAKSIVQVFLGLDGQKTVMDDIIEVGKDFFVLGAGGRFKEDFSIYTDQWSEKRKKKKIYAKIISTNRKEFPIWKLNKVKYLKNEQTMTSTFIYGNKIALFIREEPIMIILIENKKLVKDYFNYFNILWEIAED
jgi:sugar-specific transcriptional regulator TrmB